MRLCLCSRIWLHVCFMLLCLCSRIWLHVCFMLLCWCSHIWLHVCFRRSVLMFTYMTSCMFQAFCVDVDIYDFMYVSGVLKMTRGSVMGRTGTWGKTQDSNSWSSHCFGDQIETLRLNQRAFCFSWLNMALLSCPPREEIWFPNKQKLYQSFLGPLDYLKVCVCVCVCVCEILHCTEVTLIYLHPREVSDWWLSWGWCVISATFEHS